MENFNISVKDISAIASFPLCSAMTSEDIKIFVRHLVGVQYASGEVIFSQGQQENDNLYIVLEGKVAITATLEDLGNNAVAVSVQERGDVAGILSFIDGRPHKASAKAQTPVTMAIVSRQDYQHFKDFHPSIAANMLQYLIIAADDLVCELLRKLSESQAYMYGVTSAQGKT